MAVTKISELNSTTSLTDAAKVLVVDGGTTKQITYSNLKSSNVNSGEHRASTVYSASNASNAVQAQTASFVEYADVANKPTLVSSSAQIAEDISGSFVEASSSLASRVESLEAFDAALDATYATDAQLAAEAVAIRSEFAAADTTLTAADAALGVRVDALEAFDAALDSTYATDAQLATEAAAIRSEFAAADTVIDGTIATLDTTLTAADAALGVRLNLMLRQMPLKHQL